jgi:hypothetical protein
MAGAAFRGALGLLVVLVLAVGIGAFAGVGPLAGVTPASSVTDPREMAARALQAVIDADAVHLDMQVTGSLPATLVGLDDDLVDLEGTIADADIPPREAKTRLHLEVPAAAIDLDTVSSWDALWYRTAPGGTWTRGSIGEVASATGLDANPITLVDSLRAALARLPVPDVDEIACGSESGTCRLVTIDAGTAAGDVVRRSVLAGSGVTLPPLFVTVSLQADAETLRPYQLDVDVLSLDGSADMRLGVEFSGWNEAVHIEEPEPS